MRNLFNLTLIVLISLLAACAPATAGSLQSQPFMLGEDDIVVEAGEVYYISFMSDEALELFGLELNEMNSGTDTHKLYYTELPSYDAGVSNLPRGWLSVQDVRGVRDITSSKNTGSAIYVGLKDSAEFRLTLNIPADAEPGSYTGQVTLKPRSGDVDMSFEIPFTVANLAS